MPFGFCTVPATFQCLMHKLFYGMLFKGVMVFLDDILVYGKSQVEHDALLNHVFKLLRKSGSKINPGKCTLNTDKLKFLGHTVSYKGIESNNEKSRKFLKWSY